MIIAYDFQVLQILYENLSIMFYPLSSIPWLKQMLIKLQSIRYFKIMQQHFLYLNWDKNLSNSSLNHLKFYDNIQSSVEVTTSVGPYKNNYASMILEKNNIYYWEIKIIKGNYFKIGIMKHKTILEGFKGNAFSDSTDGYALYSVGKLRNGSNSTGNDFNKGYGPGDVVKVCFNARQGKLFFARNNEDLKLAFEKPEFKKGGFVPAVSALIQGSKYSLTIPDLQD